MYLDNNKNFVIIIKYKNYLYALEDYLENVPRKDMFYKDKLRGISLDVLEYIYQINNENNIDNIINLEIKIKTKLNEIDFLLERLIYKKYVSYEQGEKICKPLIEVNKMIHGWVKGKINAQSKNFRFNKSI